MIDSEIAKLYETLSLADEDVTVHEMTDEVTFDGAKDVDRSLVGKVLSTKKVNREAFKGLIEQIWNPFGQVDVELVGGNIFMFHFTNPEDRDRVWSRGPWHFGNSLIALEKPIDDGNISRLGFNKADFWIQIHEIPIICMNRRTAKWLAEQMGEVVEIPAESRECWGRYMRVKVRIDISKPLKRWLRLRFGKSEEITMVTLKYERLPEFCFACGRIGHCVKECLDEEARKASLEGSLNRFGSWLRATVSDRTKPKNSQQGYGSSSDRSRSYENPRDVEGNGSVSLRSGSMASQKVTPESSAAVLQPLAKERIQETLSQKKGLGPAVECEGPTVSRMCIDELDRVDSGSKAIVGPQAKQPNPKIAMDLVVFSDPTQRKLAITNQSKPFLTSLVEEPSVQPMGVGVLLDEIKQHIYGLDIYSHNGK